MGTAGSHRRIKSDDTVRQLPALHPLREQPPAKQESRPAQPQPKPKQPEIEWPLPKEKFDYRFKPKWSTDSERYSIKRMYNLRASLFKKQFKITKVSEDKSFHQKETSSTKWEKQISSTHDSAHVQSSLYTRSHACVNLSTTEEIDKLFINLSEVHTQRDLNVEQHQKLVSEVTKFIIDLVINDTRDMQQSLLEFGKEIQIRQDYLYREWLQNYIIQLDEWKSRQLYDLQMKMEEHQRGIIDHSQQLIMFVNSEASKLKESLMKTEQQQASSKIQELIEKIQTIPTHHLGTETMTKINLIIHGNVGNKMPGQGCTFDFDHNDNSHQRKEHGVIVVNHSTKADLQKSNKPIISNEVDFKRRIVENQHEKQIIAHVQREKTEEKQHNINVEDYEDEQ